MSYPMYVLMTEEDFREAIEDGEDINDLGPDEDILYNEADFIGSFGNEGFVSSTDINDDKMKRREAAESIIHYLGKDVCDFETRKPDCDVLVFSEDGLRRYAEKELKHIRMLLDSMTPEKYLDFGSYKLKTAIFTDEMFVHPYGDHADGEFTQSIDYFITGILSKSESRKFVIPQILWLHS